MILLKRVVLPIPVRCKPPLIALGADLEGCGIDGTYNPFPNFEYTGPLRPVYPLSPKRTLPEHIGRPDYAEDGRFRLVRMRFN